MIENLLGSESKWRLAEAPLIAIDPIFDKFSWKHNLVFTRNNKGWPSRSLSWEGRCNCLLQLYLHEVEDLSFNLWFCASQDRKNERYWKEEMRIKGRPFTEFRNALPDLVQEGWEKLQSWGPDDLVFVTKIDTPIS